MNRVPEFEESDFDRGFRKGIEQRENIDILMFGLGVAVAVIFYGLGLGLSLLFNYLHI